MDGLTLSVLAAAGGIAVLHTVVGPDHYLPFVALARARGWGLRRTLVVTAVCGLGHVLSSAALGLVGVAIGAGVGAVERSEGMRGSLAAWMLVAFGGAYALWGVRHALRQRRGLELHEHGGHVHLHGGGSHSHSHSRAAAGRADGGSAGFWTLFTIFVLGPCEPLIPLVVLPASEGRWGLAGVTTLVFGAVTVLTMTAVVAAAAGGARALQLGPLERWAHSLAGLMVAGSGLAVLFAGL